MGANANGTPKPNVDNDDDYDSDEEGAPIDELFPTCDLLTATELDEKAYLLHIDSTSESDPCIACCLSDGTCTVQRLLSGAAPTKLKGHTDLLIGCKFSERNGSLLYTASKDGTIRLWDVRTCEQHVATCRESVGNNNVNCFDVSSNDVLLAAGTEFSGGDSYVLFWDIRNYKFVGGYWECHTDDITQVQFHPDDMDKLMSGSTDGLINIYDLSQSCEEDALMDTLNTESSVERLLWFDGDKISCVTHTSDLQLWTSLDKGEPYGHFGRSELAKAVKRKNDGYIYIASHEAGSSLLVLVGSNYNEGECARGLRYKNGQLVPSLGFKGNVQRIRCSWCSHKGDVILTGGEKGTLNVWKTKGEL